MKVSLSWVEEILGRSLDRGEAVSMINAKLAAVESVLEIGPLYRQIRVAKIISANSHPQAEKLGVYEIDVGSGQQTVVAGDRKLKPGDLVAYVPPGYAVPASIITGQPLIIGERMLRGVTSKGMLASEEEMFFSGEGDSVMVLPPGLSVGQSVEEALGLDDWIVEIENKALTQRPDCFGMLGIAREVAAMASLKLDNPDWYSENVEVIGATEPSLALSVENRLPESCNRYMAVALEGVKIQPSPLSDKIRLSHLGIRPQNNIVDATNMAMLLTAQPVHAFDYDKVEGGKIIVRNPQAGESLRLINGQQVELQSETVLIADPTSPLAIAGVMGGQTSEISKETQRLLIEVANFDMYRTRGAMRSYGLSSEAATRFARDQSPAQCPATLQWLCRKLTGDFGGRIGSAIIDDYPRPQKPIEVALHRDQIRDILGIKIDDAGIDSILDRLGLRIDTESQTESDHVVVPFWRRDLSIIEDLAEEVGRLDGYDQVPSRHLRRDNLPPGRNALIDLAERCRRSLVAAGGNELLTYSALSAEMLHSAGWKPEDAYRIRNSRSPELEYLRLSLIPSVLAKVRWNQRQGYPQILLFEVNPVHSRQFREGELPQELYRLAAVFSADQNAAARFTGAAYFQAKFYAEYTLGQLGIDGLRAVSEVDKQSQFVWAYSCLKKNRRGVLVNRQGTEVAVIGEPSAELRKRLKLPAFTAALEISLDELLLSVSGASRYHPLARFPAVRRDITAVPGKDCMVEELLDVVKKYFSSRKDIAYQCKVSDLYRPDSQSLRHITLSLEIRHTKATLQSVEAAQIMDGLTGWLKRELKAEIL